MYDFELIRSARRTISIEIKRDRRIIVRAPYSVSNFEIKRFVESKRDWIGKTLKKISALYTSFPADQEPDESPVFSKSAETIEELISEAKRVIPAKVGYYANIMGVSYGRITIRNQKSRWGSCSSKGNLNFNCHLMEMPEELLDYVIIHELCHRREMNHSKAFWDEVKKYCPDYKILRKRLKAYNL